MGENDQKLDQSAEETQLESVTAPPTDEGPAQSYPLDEAEKPEDGVAEADDVIVIPREVFNYLIIGVVFFAMGALLGSFVFPYQSGVPDDFETVLRLAVQDAISAQFEEQTARAENNGFSPNERYELVLDDDDPSLGPADAPVTIIEYSDFTCGFCGVFARDTLGDLLETYDGQVRIIYRDYPILSQNSYTGALAAECAHDQDMFWEYHDALFEDQQAITTDGVFVIAEDLGLDMDAFAACFDDEIHRDEIVADFQSGNELGQMGTPTFFINGRYFSGAQPLENFVEVIDAELAAIEQS